MRTFYVFKIKEEYVSLTKNNPFHLFKMLDYIYNLEYDEIERGKDLFNKITDTFNSKAIDIKIFKNYQDNYFYTKFKNIHQINNFYRKESSKLIVRKKFLLLKSNCLRPTFVDDLVGEENVFLCDFKNKDYFFLEKMPGLAC